MATNVTLSSWDETAQSIKKVLFESFPNLKELCLIGEGVLCHLEHPKPQYQLGYVFPLEDFKSGRKETIIYYPAKKAFVHHFQRIKGAPVSEPSPFIRTKRGNMKITEMPDGQYGVTFTIVS